MKKRYFLFILLSQFINAQVGINTTNPNAQLDIRASNQAAPTNTDGMLIPKIDVFPATNPTLLQQGMLVYLTTVSGVNQPGYYYWDNPTLAWIGFGNNNNNWKTTGNAGTNIASNFIGTTDNVDVVFKRNNVRAGLLSLSNTSFGTNSLISNSFGNANTANGANALSSNTSGTSNTANGVNSLASNLTGNVNLANGANALMSNTTGSSNIAIGFTALFSNLTGNENIAIGSSSDVTFSNLTNATAIGAKAEVSSSNAMVLGSIAGVNGATSSVNVGIGTTIPLDKLHVVGNIRIVDGNQAVGKVLTSDANGTATWQNSASGTLDQAYDFGGAGLGKTITADAGAVLINGTDGFVSTGTYGIGAIAPSGAGVKMFWNPRKAAFRAGLTHGTEWDNSNIGPQSIAFGEDTIANALYSTAFGNDTKATNLNATAFGFYSVASGGNATAFGDHTTASGGSATSFGSNTTASGGSATSFGNFTDASGNNSTALGSFSKATGINSIAFGLYSLATGDTSSAFGQDTNAIGINSTAFGLDNTASSYGETVLGIGATTYTKSTNGSTQFRIANATDRLFVIGNAIDGDNDGTVDTIERSDALVILKNGKIGIGSSNPQEALHVVGKIRIVDGSQGAGKVLTCDSNGTGVWNTFSATNAWGLGGNVGTNSSVNFIGTSDNEDIVFKRNNIKAGFIGTSNIAFGINALPFSSGGNNTALGFEALKANTTAINNIAIGFQSLLANTTGTNNTAIGVLALDSNTVGIDNTAVGRGTLVDNLSGDSNTAIGRDALFNSTSDNNTALGRGTLSGVTTGSNNTAIGFNAQVASATNSNQVRIGNTAVTLASVQVAFTITSDKRWKSNIQQSNLGLDFIKQLNPVFYTRKDVEVNNENTTILETTSNPTTEYGFIAQELESTLKNFDTTNNGIISKDDAGMYGVRYNDLIAPMVKAMQEQQAIIDKQKEEINQLKQQFEVQTNNTNEILKRIEKLEKN